MTEQQRLQLAMDRMRMADSYGLDWGALLRKDDVDPKMVEDVVLIVRAYLAEHPK